MFGKIRSQLVAQRYSWIRIGVVAGLSFLKHGVKPQHIHELNEMCNSDSDYWIDFAYNEVIKRHS